MRREIEAELEALWCSAVRAQDLVMGNVDGSSLLATSMSAVVERLEGWIDTTTSNGVNWGSYSALVDAVLHFQELDANLEVLASGHNVGLIEDEVDDL
jgi:hypothetical protein